jgi:serine/threonine protein kinase
MVEMEQLTGKQLGPYRVVAPIGAGGMATVYQAYQPGMDRYVALKILPQHLARDPQFLARFQHEAKIIANLQHPHILPVFDFGEAENYTYLVMPFVATGTLAATLHGQPLPIEQIDRIISQVGDALDYAHSYQIIHRDVKPSNVLIDARGNCLLTDFGIAKMVAGTVQLTVTGGIVGTPAYMSPEQAQGASIDPRSDIYALGVVLYELATGRVPFTAETPLAVVLKHIHDPLPPPRTLNPGIPDSLERIILKALAKDPIDRYQTAADLVRAMHEALRRELAQPAPAESADQQSYTTIKLRPSGQTPNLSPSSSMPRLSLYRIARDRWRIIVGLGVLLLVVLALGRRFVGVPFSIPGAPPREPAAAGSPTLPAQTPLVVVPAEPDWIAIGGTWIGPNDGVVHGETAAFEGLYLYRQTYTDFTFTTEAQAVDREASVAFRMQDANNGYVVIMIPTGAIGGNPGIYLAKRVQGVYSFLASTQQHLPAVGQWASISIQVLGMRMQVSVNGTVVLDVADTAVPHFTQGRIGFRIYGDTAAPCHANFRNMQLPPAEQR